MALEYAKRGAKLVLVARRENRLREVADECMDCGAKDAAVCRADISLPEDCKRIVDFALDTFGRLDILVNNAGAARSGLFEDYQDTNELKNTMAVDFWGNILPTYHALEHLRRTYGQIVVTDSVGAYVPYPRQAMYNAAKAAVLQFYETLRIEPLGERVTITIAMPGFAQSEMTLGAPPGHIPKWWPMMPTQAAARRIVDAAVKRARYVIVPFWYWSWLPYRFLAPQLLEWPPRMFLLGQPPTESVGKVAEMLLGDDNATKLFQKIASLGGLEM